MLPRMPAAPKDPTIGSPTGTILDVAKEYAPAEKRTAFAAGTESPENPPEATPYMRPRRAAPIDAHRAARLLRQDARK